MDFSELTDDLQHLTQTEFLYVGGAILALTFLLILLVRRQPKNVVAYSTENGRVMVSRHAIIDLVQTSCGQLENVSKTLVKIKGKGQTTNLEVRIVLLSGGRLREIEQTLQSHLREALTENLGIESLGYINIVATGFKSGRIDSNDRSKSNPLFAGMNEAYDDVEGLDSDSGIDDQSKSSS
tara:strand:+ start:289 stop:831 length:543 start_codon:yes stop_codon:yes gene_type:complete